MLLRRLPLPLPFGGVLVGIVLALAGRAGGDSISRCLSALPLGDRNLKPCRLLALALGSSAMCLGSSATGRVGVVISVSTTGTGRKRNDTFGLNSDRNPDPNGI